MAVPGSMPQGYPGAAGGNEEGGGLHGLAGSGVPGRIRYVDSFRVSGVRTGVNVMVRGIREKSRIALKTR
jgi:hypothetical protein